MGTALHLPCLESIEDKLTPLGALLYNGASGFNMLWVFAILCPDPKTAMHLPGFILAFVLSARTWVLPKKVTYTHTTRRLSTNTSA